MAVGLREAQRSLDHLNQQVDVTASPLQQLTTLYTEVSDQVLTNALLRRVLDTEPESVLPKLTTDAEVPGYLR